MARPKGARKIEAEPMIEPTAEPRAPQAFTTGEYHFFREAPHAGSAATALPVASAAWLVPLIGAAALAILTFLLLR
jgi:hypothetical protein